MEMTEEIFMTKFRREVEHAENEAYELKVKDEKRRKTIQHSMETIEEKIQEVNGLVIDLNNLQRPKTKHNLQIIFIKTENPEERKYEPQNKLTETEHTEEQKNEPQNKINEMLDITKEIQIQIKYLEFQLECVKKETKEIEMLKYQMEIKQKGYLNILRSVSRIQQENKLRDAELKLEKKSLKRWTQKLQKDLNCQLEVVTKDLDRLEILKQNIKKCQKKATISVITNDPNQCENKCDGNHKCIGMHTIMRTHCEYLSQIIHDIKQKMSRHPRISSKIKCEVEHTICLEIKRKKEMCGFKKITQEVKKRKNDLQLIMCNMKQNKADIQRQISFLKKKELLNETLNELENTMCDLRINTKTICSSFDDLSRKTHNLKGWALHLKQRTKQIKHLLKKIVLKTEQNNFDNVMLTKDEDFKEKLNKFKMCIQIHENYVEDFSHKNYILYTQTVDAAMTIVRNTVQKPCAMRCYIDVRSKIHEIKKKKEKLNSEGDIQGQISKEREKLLSVKTNINVNRKSLKIDMGKTQQLRTELKLSEDQLITKLHSLEKAKANLQEANESRLENISKKGLYFETIKETIQKKTHALKTMVANLDQVTHQILNQNKLIQEERIRQDGLLSSMVKQRKLLKENQKDIDATTERLIDDRGKLVSKTNNIEEDRTRLTIEKDEIDLQHAELKAWEHNLEASISLLEKVKVNLQEENDKKREGVYEKNLQIENNKCGMQEISLAMKNTLADLDQMTDQVTVNRKLLLRKGIQLGSLLSSVVKQKEELDETRENVDSALNRVSNERETLNLLKRKIDVEKEEQTMEKDRLEQMWSDLKVRQNQVINNVQFLQNAKANLQEVNERNIRSNHKILIKFEQNKKGVQTVTLSLKNMLVDLKRVTDQVSGKNKLLLRQRYQLGRLLSIMVEQKEELNEKCEDLDSHIDRISKEREKLLSIKTNIDVDRKSLQIDMEKRQQLRTELKLSEEHIITKLHSLEKAKANLQEANESRLENISKKGLKFDTNKETIQNETLALKKMVEDLDQVTHQILNQNKLLQVERFRQDGLLSSMVKQREQLKENQKVIDATTERLTDDRDKLVSKKNYIEEDRTRLTIEKDDMEQQQAELKVLEDQLADNVPLLEKVKVKMQEKNDKKLEGAYEKNLQMEINKRVMQKILLATKNTLANLDQMTDQVTINRKLLLRKRIQLGSLLSSVVKQKEELDETRENVDSALNRVSNERETWNLLKRKIDVEKEQQTMEKDRLEQMRSDLKVRQDQVINNVQFLQTAKANLREVSEKNIRSNHKILIKFEQNKKGVQTVTLSLKNMLVDLERVTDQVSGKNKLILRQRYKLSRLLSIMVEQKEELNEKREDLDSHIDRISKDREKLLSIKTNINVNRKSLKIDMEKTQQLRTELKLSEDQLITKLHSLEKAKANLQEANESRLENISKKGLYFKTIKETIQKKTHALKKMVANLDQMTHQILNQNKLIQEERIRQYGLLSSMVKQRKQLKENQKDIDATTERLIDDRGKLVSKTNNIEEDRTRLTIEKDEIDLQHAELKAREHNLEASISLLEKVKVNLQEENDKKREGVYEKNLQIENKCGMKEISLAMKNTLADLDQMTDQVTVNRKLLLRKGIQLGSLLSSVVKQKEELDETRENVDSALNRVSNERETLNLLKRKIDVEKEEQTMEKDRLEQMRSDLKVRQDQVINNVQFLQTAKANLQEVSEKNIRSNHKILIKFEQNKKGVQTVTLSLKNMLVDLERVTDQVSGKNKLLLRQRYQLGRLLSIMVEQKEELNEKRENIDSHIDRISKDRKKLLSIKTNINVDRKSLKIDMEKTQQLRTELKLSEDHLITKLHSLEKAKANLQEANESRLENIFKKGLYFETIKETIKKKTHALKKMVANLDQVTDQILNQNKLMQEERIRQDGLLSSMVKQREQLKGNQKVIDATTERLTDDRGKLVSKKNITEEDRTRLTIEKDEIDLQHAELKAWEHNLEASISLLEKVKVKMQEENDKKLEGAYDKNLQMEINKCGMQKISLAMKNTLANLDQITDQVTVNRKLLLSKRIRLGSLLSSVVKQKEELDETRENVDSALNRVSNERETLNLLKRKIDVEKEEQTIEKDRLEQMRSDLKVRQDQVIKNVQFLQTAKANLQEVNEKNIRSNHKILIKFEQNKKGVQTVTLSLKNMLVDLKRVPDQVSGKNKLLLRQRYQLGRLLSIMVEQKEELNEKREDLDSHIDRISKEREKLLSIKTNIDVDRKSLQIDMEKRQQLRTELKLSEEHIVTKLHSLEKAKANLQEANESRLENISKKGLKFDTNKETIQNETLALKKMVEDLDQVTHQILNQNKLLQVERFRQDGLLSSMVKQKEQLKENQKVIDATTERLTDDRDKLVSKKNYIEEDRTRLTIEKDDMEQQQAELKVLEDQLADNVPLLEKVKVKMQEKNDKKLEGAYERNLQMEINKCVMQKILLATKNTLANLDQMTDQVTINRKLLLRKRIQLGSLLSSVVKQKEELDETRENVDSALNRVSNERETLNLLKRKIDVEKEEQTMEKDRLEQMRSDLKVRQNQVINNVQFLQTAKANLQEVSEKNIGSNHEILIKFEQNKKGVQTVTLSLKNMLVDLERVTDQVSGKNKLLLRQRYQLGRLLSIMVEQKEELNEKRENIDSHIDRISKDRKKLLSIKTNINVDRKSLKIDMEKTQQLRAELKLSEDHLITKLHSLEKAKANLQEANESRLENISKKGLYFETIKETIKKKTHALKKMVANLDQVTHQILNQNKLMQEERIRQDGLLSSMVKQREQLKGNQKVIDATTERLTDDRGKLVSKKNITEEDRTRLTIEKDEIDLQHAELKAWEHNLEASISLLEKVKVKMQEENDKKLEGAYEKNLQMEINKCGMQKISLAMKNTLANLDQITDQVTVNRKLLLSKRIRLGSLLSSVVKQKEELDETRENVDSALNRVSNERETLNLLKRKIDVEKEEQTMEKDRLEQMRSDLKVRQDQVINNVQFLQNAKANLQEVNERNIRSNHRILIKFEQNKKGVQTVTFSLKNMLVDLKRVPDQVSGKNKLLLRQRYQLGRLLSIMVEQKEELNEKREDLDSHIDRISKEREKLLSIKTNIDVDRKSLQIDMEKTQQLRTELKLSEEDIITKLHSLEKAKANLQEANESKLENISKKGLRFDTNKETIQNETLALKKMVEDLDQVTNQILNQNKLLQVERFRQDGLLSSMVKQREQLKENQKVIDATTERLTDDRNKLVSKKNYIEDRTRLTIEKDDMEQQQAELKVLEDQLADNVPLLEKVKVKMQEENDKKLEGAYEKNLQMEINKCGMQKISLAMKNTLANLDQMTDQVTIDRRLLLRERIQLGSLLSSVVKQKEELDETRENVDSALNTVSNERETLNLLKRKIDVEKEEQTMEKDRLEQMRSDLKVRQDQVINNVQFLQTAKANLQEVNEKNIRSNHEILIKFEQKEKGVQTVTLLLKNILVDLERVTDQVSCKNKLLLRQRYQLGRLLSIMVEQKEELNEKREIIDSHIDRISKDREKLLSIKTNIDVDRKSLKIDMGKTQLRTELEYIEVHLITMLYSLKKAKANLQEANESRLENIPTSLAKQDISIASHTSKRDCLRKIWKDTNIEKKLIDQMKCTGHEMRKHLEEQLKVITNFVETYWILKKKTFVKKTDQRFFQAWQSHSEKKRKSQDKKNSSLQKFKIEMH
ncbi:centromere-associated protein E-like isoform X1 [Syngnathus typhle]|uniref:centromere-associated protein E-like isoform X1 n=1 Tax=Syngnathus typhle TaxID=161592 RepID=UPI002A6A0B31|nr:centromere-associated protein E-like isoform X1 [Syngnathus typhle]XP_061141839.1 centromere-associated protein E-like isoform X1 [Syngnathus typhle]